MYHHSIQIGCVFWPHCRYRRNCTQNVVWMLRQVVPHTHEEDMKRLMAHIMKLSGDIRLGFPMWPENDLKERKGGHLGALWCLEGRVSTRAPAQNWTIPPAPTELSRAFSSACSDLGQKGKEG